MTDREHDQLLLDLRSAEEVTWYRPDLPPVSEALPDVGLTTADVDDAAARLRRFAPYITQVFPETKRSAGIIESPLVAVPSFQESVSARYDQQMPGLLWLKLDSDLPISGSIKARGGIYEVLQHAERIALDAGLITLDSDYRALATPEARELFGRYRIAVGSTGNLGLSIGIMGAMLGFETSVHMSADARQWKKDELRRRGVTVHEYASDYSVAVAQGRQEAASDPATHFVDDENSITLFLGYAVAARRLAGQLIAAEIIVDADHPLFVYLPCGVGGGPGGVAFGLKNIFGDHVHCIFAEPTHAPCMLLGTYTDRHDGICVQDIGLDNVTAADGLAVGRASGFVGKRLARLLDGFITVDDDELFRLISELHTSEGIAIEPSAAAGIPGPWRFAGSPDLLARREITADRMSRATHIAWATGGSMVPDVEMSLYQERGAELLRRLS